MLQRRPGWQHLQRRQRQQPTHSQDSQLRPELRLRQVPREVVVMHGQQRHARERARCIPLLWDRACRQAATHQSKRRNSCLPCVGAAVAMAGAGAKAAFRGPACDRPVSLAGSGGQRVIRCCRRCNWPACKPLPR